MTLSADDFLDGAPSKSADDFLDGAPDHSNIVSKSLAATVKSPVQLPQSNVQAPPAWKRGLAAIPGLGPLGAPSNEPWKPEEQDMAKNGVDIMSGGSAGLRNRLSLVVNPTDKTLRDTVNQYYKQDVGLARNQYGELEFTNPETGRRTLLNPRGQTLQQLAPTAGESMDTVGQTGGSLAAGIPTAMATGNPVLAATAGAAGAGFGQALSDTGKTVINSFLGTGNRDNASDQISDIAKSAGKAAGVAAIGEVIGLGPAAGRFIKQGFLDLKFSKALDLQQMTKEASTTLNDYQTLIGSQAGVKPSISELVPDPKTRITYEKAYKSTEDLTAEEEKRINSNLDTLAYNYKNFSDTFKPRPDYEYGSSGANIQQEMEAKKASALASQQAQDAVVKADYQSQMAGLPAMTETERNQELTEMLNKLKAAGEDEKNKAYGDLKVALGVPKEVAYDRGASKWFQERNTKNVVDLAATTRTTMQNMWNEGMKLQNSPLRSGDKYFSAIPEDFFVDVNKPELGLKDLKTLSYDPLSLIDNIQDLNSGTRAAMAASRGRIPADQQASADVAKSLEESITSHFMRRGDPAVLDAWDNARFMNQQFEDNFNRGIINTVMKKSGGFQDPVYNSATTGLLMRAGKGADQSGVAKFAQLLNGAPDEKERVRTMLWSIYNDHGYTDWNKFKDDFEGPIKYFFTDAEQKKLDSFSGLQDVLADSASKLANFNKAWKSQPELRGIPTTSQGLSNAVFRGSVSPQALTRMVAMVKTMQPSLLKEWQADTARQFAIQTADASYMPVDSLVSKYLDQYGDRLNKVMGPEYVQKLRAYQKVAQMVQGGTGVKLDPDRPQSIWTQVVRAKFAPPLSEEGRWYSALLNLRKRAAGRVVYNALKSPTGLDDFITMSQANAVTPLVSGILAKYQGASLVNSLTGQPGTPPNSSSELQTR